MLDATPLGWGADPGLARTGIFRSTAGLVFEALRRPDLEIQVGGVYSYIADLSLARFDRFTGGLLAGRHVESWQHPSVPRAESIALLDRRAGLADDAFAEHRAISATLALTSHLAAPVPVAGRYDIYQSFRPPLAARERIRAAARVLYVHDIIPILFPDIAKDGADTEVRAMLASADVARDWLLCNSESTRSDLCGLVPGLDPARVFLVPLAADRAIFHPVTDAALVDDTRRRYGLGDRPYVLSLSTIEPRKNLPHLIRCFARLMQDLPPDDEVQLVLVGATGWKSDGVFATVAADPGVARRIVFAGYVPDADLAALYAGADVFVYPSRYEGFGLPVLEAMQCGVPVVTTTGGSLPEVAGDAALLVDPDDGDALVEAMSAARRSARLSAAGLVRAGEFTWARSVDLMVAAWRTMLEQDK